MTATTHTFHCPTCGAPILLKRSSPLARCSYCRTSVVVPEALQPQSAVDAWSTLVFDGFMANEHDWLVGDQAGERFTALTRRIADGRYRWEAQAQIACSIAPAWLQGYPVADFHLRVNGKLIHGRRAGCSWGVLFRVQDNQNGYCFRIGDTQFFALSVVRDGHWSQVINWTRSDRIKPQGVNQLEVIMQDTHVGLVINGQIVSELDLEDDRFPNGLVGLAIEGYTPGDSITVDFLDLLLRAP